MGKRDSVILIEFTSNALCILGIILILVLSAISFTGCTQAEKVSYNLSKEADNFNVVRELTVINGVTNEIVFQMTGRLSIFVDSAENQLEVTVENGNNTYCKHFIGLGDNTIYVVEDLNLGDNEVQNYKYTLNFNPNMLVPYDVEQID